MDQNQSDGYQISLAQSPLLPLPSIIQLACDAAPPSSRDSTTESSGFSRGQAGSIYWFPCAVRYICNTIVLP